MIGTFYEPLHLFSHAAWACRLLCIIDENFLGQTSFLRKISEINDKKFFSPTYLRKETHPWLTQKIYPTMWLKFQQHSEKNSPSVLRGDPQTAKTTFFLLCNIWGYWFLIFAVEVLLLCVKIILECILKCQDVNYHTIT